MRAIIEGFPLDWQIDIIKGLILVEPVYWIANDIGNREQINDNCIFHSAESLIAWQIPQNILKQLNIKSPIPYISDEILLEDTDQIDFITRIIRIRKELYGKSFASNEGRLRRSVYRQIAYWMKVIEKLKPEIILFEQPPHLVHHYSLYYSAKKKGLRTIIINRVGDPVRFMMSENINNLVPEKIVNEPKKVERISAKKTKPEYAISGPSATISNTRIFKKIISKPQKLFRRGSYNYILSIIKNKIYDISFSYLYNRYSLKEIPKQKFVYFSLSESPEDTTYPGGWNFEDQVYAIGYLSELLPNDITILVKEHPNQRYWRGRYLSFYDDLKRCKNVELIDKKIDSFKLIERCSAVATITGQAGWEALTNNKRVIYFGQAWYQDAPGTININKFKDMTSKKRENFLKERSVLDLQDWYEDFHKRSFPGYINNIVNSGELPDISKVVYCINKFLSGERVQGVE